MTKLAAKLRRVSFRTRLGTLTAIAVGVTVALAAVASYITVHHELFSQLDSSLTGEASNAPSLFTGPGGQFEPDRAAAFLRRSSGDILQVITAQTTALNNERNDIDILRRRMDATVLLVKVLGGGWDTTQLPPP